MSDCEELVCGKTNTPLLKTTWSNSRPVKHWDSSRSALSQITVRWSSIISCE